MDGDSFCWGGGCGGAAATGFGVVGAWERIRVVVGRGGGGTRSDEVAVNEDVVLDHAFAGEDYVFGAEDGGAAGDFVAGFLVVVRLKGMRWMGWWLRSRYIRHVRWV